MKARRKEQIGDCTLYLGDCLEVLPTLGKVDAVFTSPPYADQRDYGGDYFSWDDAGRFLDLLPVGDHSQVFVNCGLVHKRGGPYEYWRGLFGASLPFFGWYVWDQGFGLPGNWNGRLAPSFEFIFHFCREAYETKKTHRCASVGRKISQTALTKKDGTSAKATGAGNMVNTHRIPDSVVRVTREMRREWGHPAKFPVGLPLEFIGAYSDEGSEVLDPFMGSGTTGVACVQLGRKFIGIEIDETYFDIACERIANAERQPDMFISKPEQASML